MDSFAETEFAKFLWKKDIQPFYPFKDVGIDMIGVSRIKVEFYQLKARNPMAKGNNIYGFPITKKGIQKLSKLKNSFFILCTLQPNKTFHFFKLPPVIIREYDKQRKASKYPKRHKTGFFKIEKIDEKTYRIRPKYIKIDINEFRLA